MARPRARKLFKLYVILNQHCPKDNGQGHIMRDDVVQATPLSDYVSMCILYKMLLPQSLQPAAAFQLRLLSMPCTAAVNTQPTGARLGQPGSQAASQPVSQADRQARQPARLRTSIEYAVSLSHTYTHTHALPLSPSLLLSQLHVAHFSYDKACHCWSSAQAPHRRLCSSSSPAPATT